MWKTQSGSTFTFFQRSHDLLHDALLSDRPRSLWSEAPQLLELARSAFERDVLRAAEELHVAIHEIPEVKLIGHGLVGFSARFKFNVIAFLSGLWDRAGGAFTVRAGFKRVVEAIDGPLGSLVEAAGVGGAIKEFKEALLALAPEE